MKIVSLLPSATEIVFALGLGPSLAGRSFECDYPSAAREVPVVSGTALALDDGASPRDIDTEVRDRIEAGTSIYTLDVERIRAIDPDLILAQDLCAVCAVPSGAVNDALAVLGSDAQVVSLDPNSLDDVVACIGQVGAATGVDAEADVWMRNLRTRIRSVRDAVADCERPRVLPLEWADPPFNGGHWIPDMITAAGGEPVLSPPRERSRRLDWPEIAGAEFDVVLFMPCGYGLDGATAGGADLLARAELAGGAEVWAVDANAYFSRPGPRVVDGVELLASVLHPDRMAARPGAVRLR